jgi:Protein of unknown function (DUF2612)/PASTA domain
MSLTWTLRAAPGSFSAGPLACNPATGVTILATPFNFFKSTDAAVSWSTLLTPPSAGGGQVSVAFGGGKFIAYASGTLYISADDGATWTNPAVGPSFTGPNIPTMLAFSPTLGTGLGMWLVEQNDGFSTSIDGGNHWSTFAAVPGMSSGPSNTNNLFWDGTVFAFSGRDTANLNSVIATSADGATWSLINFASIFGPDEIETMSSNGSSYVVGMVGSKHVRRASTIAGLVGAPNTDLGAILTGNNPVRCVFIPIAGALLAVASISNGGSANVLAEQDTPTSPWILSPSPAGFNTGNACIWWAYDAFHAVIIGSVTGATAQIITTPYVPGVAVPNVIGITQIAATLAITSAGLTLGPISSTYSATVSPGLVALQVPAAGTILPPGSPVAITLSLGSPHVVVPDVIGMTAALAESTIAGAQLVTGTISGILDPDIAIGSVGTQSPLPGTIVFAGTPVNLGISFIVPEFDVDATVISQYANSPTILAMVANFAEYFDPAQNLQSFYLDVWNIDTAIGFGLDIWGRILGVSRVIPIPGTSGAFGFENSDSPPDWENFGNLNDVLSGGPFFSGQISGNSYKLNDGPYRTLLLTKALGNICATTAPALNALITNLFPGRGRCYTKDGGAMTMTYVFEFPLTTIEYAILAYSGVLAHPAGVGVNINVAAGGFLGFAEALPGVEPFNFGVFFGA